MNLDGGPHRPSPAGQPPSRPDGLVAIGSPIVVVGRPSFRQRSLTLCRARCNRGVVLSSPPALRWPFVVEAIVLCACPGLTSYALTRDDPAAFVESNAIGDASWPAVALHLVGSAAIVLAIAWTLARRHGDPRTLDAWRPAFARLRWLLLGPPLVALFHDPEGFLSFRRPILILLCAAIVAAVVPRWPAAATRLRATLGHRWPLVPLVAGTVLTALHLGRLALLRHQALHTRAFDLAIYDNILFNTMHGDFLACSLVKGGVHTSAHFDPVLALLVPFYAIAPRAETLLVVQLLWVLSSVVPAYLLARHRLGDRMGATIVALLVLLYPSVHGIVLSDFHSLALLAPVALWLVVFLDTGRVRLYWVALVLVLLVREDAALFAIGVGAYAVLCVPRARRLGLYTIVASALWLAVVKLAIMPDAGLLMESSEASYTYANRYRKLIPEGGGARDAIATLVTNPAFVLTHVSTHEKLMSLIALLLPLGLLPLFAGRRLLLCAYGLAFCFLATQAFIHYPLFHYATVLYPMLFAALPTAMLHAQSWLRSHGTAPALAKARVHAWLVTCAVLSSLTMASWIETPPFQLHTPVPHALGDEERETHAWLRGVIAEIPADASVSATNRVGPHLSNRAAMHIVQQQIETEWIVAHDDDLRSEAGAWVWAMLRAGTYEEVARLEGRLRVLRRVQ
jgi:uncharacterized membrane protein